MELPSSLERNRTISKESCTNFSGYSQLKRENPPCPWFEPLLRLSMCQLSYNREVVRYWLLVWHLRFGKMFVRSLILPRLRGVELLAQALYKRRMINAVISTATAADSFWNLDVNECILWINVLREGNVYSHSLNTNYRPLSPSPWSPGCSCLHALRTS